MTYHSETEKFVESDLIAYIGNKRRLIKLIFEAVKKCGINPQEDKALFLDLFAGTGVVSRLAKAMGFKVVSNDWEEYSRIINTLYIETDEQELEKLFDGKFPQIFHELNSLTQPKEEYIAKYYCPEDDSSPDLDNERMFFTRENGLKIDAIRERIEELYPEPKTRKEKKAKDILIALLLYEVATRANTSGVFKGFHRGFGGNGQDALGRILKKLTLPRPQLINSPHKNRVYRMDAGKLVQKMKKIEFDIVYLDPPYNQHQYGSNYHLLTTVAKNDKPEVDKRIYINGKKTDKSAIRKDWVKTRSPYCYRNEATREFSMLMDNIRAKKILVSYSIDGIIPFDTMLDILSKKGKLDIVCSEYVKYRGGKQALTTQVRNVEFVLIVDTEKESLKSDIKKVREKLLEEKVENTLKKTFCIDMAVGLGWKVEPGKFFNRMKKDFGGIEADICLKNGYSYEKAEFRYKNNVSVINIIDMLPFEIKNEFFDDIDKITDITKDIEISIFLRRMKELASMNKLSEISVIFKNVIHLLKKFNNRKAYYTALKVIIKIIDALHDIGIEFLMKDRAFKSCFQKGLKLINDKLVVKRIDKSKCDEINFLRIRIKKKLTVLMDGSSELSGVSNM